MSSDVGGDLPDLIGRELAEQTIDYTDKIYLEFGADTHIEGLSNPQKVKEIRKKAIKAGLKLVDCPIRHMGTEKARDIYYSIEKYLIDNGVQIIFDTPCIDLIIENNVCKGAIVKKGKKEVLLFADRVVVATGRRGADWLERACKSHNIEHQPGTVDVGVRVEARNEIMEEVNDALYESKLIGYPFKHRKSENTNLAILCSHNFREPFNQPIEYAKKVGELTNMLGAGGILVQRYGDILSGKRTWQKELENCNVKPTLKDAVAGDITSALPYRSMISILNFIRQMDEVVPGFASSETLLYSPELKFYSNKIKMDGHFNTSVKNLHCLGDSSGWTRGLMMASVMGVLMARQII